MSNRVFAPGRPFRPTGNPHRDLAQLKLNKDLLECCTVKRKNDGSAERAFAAVAEQVRIRNDESINRAFAIVAEHMQKQRSNP